MSTLLNMQKIRHRNRGKLVLTHT